MESLVNPAAVAHPMFKIVMNSKDITAVLTPYIVSVSYTDFVEGEADTLDIRLEDADGRFRGAWYPAKGQTVELSFGFDGAPLQNAGRFEIDEIELEGPPDTVTIRAIAAGVKSPYRTRQGRTYESTTLDAIARTVSHRLKLQLIGKIDPIQITHITQIHENDLTFMRRLAGEYGYAFSIKGTRITFFKHKELRAAKPVLILSRTDLTRYHLRDKIMGVAATAQVSYHDPKTKRLRHYKVQNTHLDTSADAVKLNVRAESNSQAKAKAQAVLDGGNQDATQLDLTVYGNPKLVAGINFKLANMGRFDAVYHIVKSHHNMDRNSGYSTDIEAKRVV